VIVCLERGANDLHMVQLMPLPPHHLLLQHYPERFILLVPAYLGCPGKRPLNVCVCVCVYASDTRHSGNSHITYSFICDIYFVLSLVSTEMSNHS